MSDRLTGSFFPDSGLLRFPLKPGAHYTARYEVARPHSREAFRAGNTLEVSVVDWEEVTVPAGTFHALKIDAAGTYERTDVRRRGPLHVTLWYVPAVRRWVRWTFQNWRRDGRVLRNESHELLDYRLR